ncbi:hypothetical protein COU62_02530 [Candidatus Pacearchaeota archaeon CG10_big_fil_rev_8_21_14_0_10_35_219]|nr:hypothetical protein [Candidatus Pacearchaeota archaeon]OIO43354.1 MAG: hypothetical protein AUJ63_00475 [Candidatus Pacearchaeota archaeon CG1_02_35_32]PIO07716.1 MAG: hypothetical protein COU62_02530 [Candidatus Pacearchaeota archaeon CG10_big_fil_rev_8_21_14_0_10_35_219]PIY81502.1 MAG: hypothetical protein COY79_02055 [Candidatus Pacearchaeota archaeon CG_4_10_14_0_8_um_filter_35_169]PIZ80412.1 MAG: hypothetical protein COY00_01065 [Candidatus Pacearchaeota archaeon CG_4_10_14_0_2_um_filt
MEANGEFIISLRNKYHPNEIRDNLLNEIVMPIKENGKIIYISPYDSYKNSFEVLLFKENKRWFSIQYQGITQDVKRNKDERLLLMEFFIIDSKETIQLFLDFDRNHHTNKDIHLNSKIKTKDNNNLSDLSKKIVKVTNHLPIQFTSNKKRISYFDTFLNVLKKLTEEFPKYDYSIHQLQTDSEEFELVESILKFNGGTPYQKR